MDEKLVKMPNGAWLKPSSVVAVVPAEYNTGFVGGFKQHEPILDRVIIRYVQSERKESISGACFCEIIDCGSFEEAKSLAAEIAALLGAEEQP